MISCVRDVYVRPGDSQLVVRVVKGKGGKWREVPVFPGRELSVLAVVQGRDPDTHVFDRLPSNMDIHSYRRRFAQELYERSPVAHFQHRKADYKQPILTKMLRSSQSLPWS